nr:hypothetical protein BCU55_10800 [Shewanella sp. 10N.286.48.A6]
MLSIFILTSAINHHYKIIPHKDFVSLNTVLSSTFSVVDMNLTSQSVTYLSLVPFESVAILLYQFNDLAKLIFLSILFLAALN